MDEIAKKRVDAEIARLRAAYLDLMCDSLVGRLNRDPPLQRQLSAYDEPHRINGWDWPSAAPSMIGARRMAHLRKECERVLTEGVAGDFMETGVWRGGACMMMRAVLKAYDVSDRKVIAADTFRGPPRPTPGVAADADMTLHEVSDFSVSQVEVKSAFHRYGLLDRQVIFLEGLFKDTLPNAPVERLAILRLDADTYESTMDGLENLYAKLSPRGSLIIDDYFLFDAQRVAVDEYRARQDIADPIVRIDDYGGFWIKQSRPTRVREA